MTIKIIFERSSQKGARQGFEKRVNRGRTLNSFVGLRHRKNSILESRIFIVIAFSLEIQWQSFWTITPLQGVRPGGRKNPRVIVGENSCHFGASYLDQPEMWTKLPGENPRPIWLDNRGAGQWKWLEEVPCTSLAPPASPSHIRCGEKEA